jgi:hypothetical protein
MKMLDMRAWDRFAMWAAPVTETLADAGTPGPPATDAGGSPEGGPEPDEAEAKQAEVAAQEAAAKAEAADKAIREETAKSARDWKRLTDTVKGLQTKKADLEAELEKARVAPRAQPVPKPEVPGHPALAGLAQDGDGNVLYHGSYVSQEFVIAQYAQAQRMGELEAWKEGIEATRRANELAEHDARIVAAIGATFDDVESRIVTLRAQQFPSYQAEDAAALDEVLLTAADRFVTAAGERGEPLTEELLRDGVSHAFAHVRHLFGLVATQQLKDNQEYRDKNRVKPGGPAAVPVPKDESQLSRAERQRLIAQRTQAAEAMRPPV